MSPFCTQCTYVILYIPQYLLYYDIVNDHVKKTIYIDALKYWFNSDHGLRSKTSLCWFRELFYFFFYRRHTHSIIISITGKSNNISYYYIILTIFAPKCYFNMFMMYDISYCTILAKRDIYMDPLWYVIVTYNLFVI